MTQRRGQKQCRRAQVLPNTVAACKIILTLLPFGLEQTLTAETSVIRETVNIQRRDNDNIQWSNFRGVTVKETSVIKQLLKWFLPRKRISCTSRPQVSVFSPAGLHIWFHTGPHPPTFAVAGRSLTSDPDWLLVLASLLELDVRCQQCSFFFYLNPLFHVFSGIILSFHPACGSLSDKRRWSSYLKRGESFKHSSKSSFTVICPLDTQILFLWIPLENESSSLDREETRCFLTHTRYSSLEFNHPKV